MYALIISPLGLPRMDLGLHFAGIILLKKSKFGQERRILGGAKEEQAITLMADEVQVS